MAKEISIKVKVDGEEIDVAKQSTKEFNEQIGDLKTKLEDLPIGSKDWKKVKGDIDALEDGFKRAKQSQQGLLQNLSEAPGIVGAFGQSLKGVNEGFKLLSDNPWGAVLALLATVIVKVVDKLKDMEGVIDPLTKIGDAFSTIFSKIASFILPPIAATLELIATGAEKVLNWFGKLTGSGDGLGKTMAELSDAQDKLNDSQAEYELGLAKTNRALAEAREKANDQTLSTKERKAALEEAAKLEKKIAEEGRARALEQARITAAQMAANMNLTETEIAGLRKANAAELEVFAQRIKNRQDLNQEQRTALLKSLGTIDEIAAEESKIEKKKDTQIRAIESQAAADAKQKREEAAQQTKDYLTRLAAFQNDTRLQGIKDEQEKARVSLEIEKKKSLDEIGELKMSNTRKKELKEAALLDYAAKEKALTIKQNEENLKLVMAFNDKYRDLEIGAYSDELQRNTATREEKYKRDKRALEQDKQFIAASEETKKQMLINLEKAKNVDIQKIKDDAAKKDAENIYKQIEFERQSRLMAIQTRLQMIDNEYKDEISKINERRKLADEQAQIDRDKEVENLDKLLKAKELTEKEYLERKKILDDKYNTTIATNQINNEKAIIEQRKKNIQAVQQLGDSIGALANAMGAESEAGRVLIKVQQAIALATTAAAIAQAFMGLGKDLAKGFPTNIIAVASTLALIATAITQFKALTGSSQASGGGSSEAPKSAGNSAANLGVAYGDGGIIDGPPHAQGGMMINAEGGEAIMTKKAVTMFGPLLSQINQAGGGTSFNLGTIGQSNFDNPKSSSSNDQMIIKTYVVESELTTQQSRQARLKDLSTL